MELAQKLSANLAQRSLRFKSKPYQTSLCAEPWDSPRPLSARGSFDILRVHLAIGPFSGLFGALMPILLRDSE
jgi:hypothetical protein